jgi:enoyl-CoA hydratase
VTAPEEDTEVPEVLVERDGAVGVVTLNRPAAMNSFTTASAREFVRIVTDLVDDSTVRAIVLTGAGDRAFCAGADLKERNGMTPEQWRSQHRVFEAKNRVVRQCPKPFLVAVNGVAVAGGLEIALSADFIYAADTARFGLAEVRRGIIPGGGGTQLLARRAPLGAALELLMTGALIDAAEAYRLGIVNRLHAPGRLRDEAIRVAAVMAANSPAAIKQVKQAVTEGRHLPIEDALHVELEHYEHMVDHPDRLEGVAAFVERRTPRFADLPTPAQRD